MRVCSSSRSPVNYERGIIYANAHARRENERTRERAKRRGEHKAPFTLMGLALLRRRADIATSVEPLNRGTALSGVKRRSGGTDGPWGGQDRAGGELIRSLQPSTVGGSAYSSSGGAAWQTTAAQTGFN